MPVPEGVVMQRFSSCWVCHHSGTRQLSGSRWPAQATDVMVTSQTASASDHMEAISRSVVEKYYWAGVYIWNLASSFLPFSVLLQLPFIKPETFNFITMSWGKNVLKDNLLKTLFLFGMIDVSVFKDQKALVMYATAARMACAQKWKGDTIPTKEEWQTKLI